MDPESHEYRVLTHGSKALLSATGAYMLASTIHAYVPAFVDPDGIDPKTLETEEGHRLLFEQSVKAADDLINDAIAHYTEDLGDGEEGLDEAMKQGAKFVRALVGNGGVTRVPAPVDHTKLELWAMELFDNDTSKVTAYFEAEVAVMIHLHHALSAELDARFEAMRLLSELGNEG